MTETPTAEQFRQAGFTEAAANYPRSEVALNLLCAFNGVAPDQAPPAWWFHPNAASKAAWGRVADAARAIFAQSHQQTETERA